MAFKELATARLKPFRGNIRGDAVQTVLREKFQHAKATFGQAGTQNRSIFTFEILGLDPTFSDESAGIKKGKLIISKYVFLDEDVSDTVTLTLSQKGNDGLFRHPARRDMRLDRRANYHPFFQYT